MNNREKFINKVLEMINKKHKTNFVAVQDEKIPNDVFIIEGKVKGKHFIHSFSADIEKLTYKKIKDYGKALIAIVKQDAINA